MSKINYVTKVSEDIQNEFKATAKGLDKKISGATEEAMRLWMEKMEKMEEKKEEK